MSSVPIPPDSPATDWSLNWFAKLEKAVEAGDHEAAEAQRHLARLGVRVQYGLPGRRKGVVS